ncbi:SDR family oxidoreductase [Oxalobacteraceae bacterium OM1]|nr:SDR family oxidoreductase [Oxalobacteraceae bacterium OM1]
MPTALILGASRGIGREYVRQLRAQGWRVLATARTDADIDSLKNEGAEATRLDVTKPESLAGLGWQLDGEKLDLAVYVSGVYGPGTGATAPPSAADFDKVMHTNVLGAMQALPVVAPMVEAARGRFAFISSGMGSIASADNTHGWVYRVSKAALNMAVHSASHDYPQAIFVVLNPGWVQTDMGGPSAPLTVQDSVSSMLRVIAALQPQDSGGAREPDGSVMPW